MKLFFKHILRTLRAHPLQPLLILLTLSLCVCVCVTSLGLYGVFTRRNQVGEDQVALWGDLILRVGKDSDERMLFEDDVQAILGDRGVAFGDYSMVAFFGTDAPTLTFVNGADLAAADAYFQFDFAEYGRFTQDNLEHSAIVSKSFAKRHDLHCGDSFSLLLLGRQVTYTVEAVAGDEVYFSECDILIDRSSATKLLAEQSSAIASLGESFSPANRIMIRLDSSEDTEQVFRELSGSSLFADDYLERVEPNHSGSLIQTVESLILFILCFLCVALCAMVIASAMSFLAVQRESEYTLFAISGASPGQIGLLRLSESLLYALLGSGIGLCLAPFALNATGALFDWYEPGNHLGFGDLLFGLLFGLFFAVLCTWLSAKSEATGSVLSLDGNCDYAGKFRRESRLPPLVLSAALALFLAVCFLLPVEHRYWAAVLALVAEILLIYFVSPYVFLGVARLADRLLRRTSGLPTLRILFKNTQKSRSQIQICRLLSVLCSLLIAISLCTGVIRDTQEELETALTGDIFAVGLSDEGIGELKQKEEIDGFSTLDLYPSCSLEEDHAVIAIALSGEPEACFSDRFLPHRLPEEGEIAVSVGIAALADLEVGDRTIFSLDGHDYEFIVSEICDIRLNFVFVHPQSVKSTTQLYVISSADEQASPELMADLAAEGVAVMDVSVMNLEGLYTLNGFLKLAMVALITAACISAVGLCNMMSEQLYARRHERALLTLSGMTKGGLVKMYLLELSVIILVALAVATLSGLALFHTCNPVAESFGFVLI